MLKTIQDLPEGVLGVEISGKLTHEDYVEQLIPAADAVLAKHKPMKMLCVIGPDFTGMEYSAMWDDATYGIKHWHDFSHFALVTDENWIRTMTNLFGPIFPGEVKLFDFNQLEDAKNWIASGQQKEAA